MLDGDTSFVPYGSFERGVQEHGKFLEGGLARGLVHTSDKKANILSPIANDTEYAKGVNVSGFDSVNELIVRVVCLGSDWGLDGGRLCVGGDGWIVSGDGYVFGGLVSLDSERADAKN